MKEQSLKSCTTQLLNGEEPSSAWGFDRLKELAALLNKVVVEQEACLAAIYWQLGQALLLVRANFQHGQWQKFLQELNIEKSRASRAIAIYRQFPHREQVEKLTLKEAYSARPISQKQTRRNQRKENATAVAESGVSETSRLSQSLKVYLMEISASTEHFHDEIEFTTPAEARELLTVVEKVWVQFGELHERVIKRVAQVEMVGEMTAGEANAAFES